MSIFSDSKKKKKFSDFSLTPQVTVRVKCLIQEQEQHNIPGQDSKPDHLIRSMN